MTHFPVGVRGFVLKRGSHSVLCDMQTHFTNIQSKYVIEKRSVRQTLGKGVEREVQSMPGTGTLLLSWEIKAHFTRLSFLSTFQVF